MNEIQKEKSRQKRNYKMAAKRNMEVAMGRMHQAETHVRDLQQIYDTVNASLHMAKIQLEIYEEQNQKAIDEYHTSVGVEA
jgi:hypothetical protein